MTDADAQEYGRADEDATEIHTDFFTVANIGKTDEKFLGRNGNELGLFLPQIGENEPVGMNVRQITCQD